LKKLRKPLRNQLFRTLHKLGVQLLTVIYGRLSV